MNARWSDKYRAKLNETSPRAPGYVLLSSFEVTQPDTSYQRQTVAILHNESLGTYFWRRSILAGKIRGQIAWRDCLTTYQSLGDVITDIAQEYYDEALKRAEWVAQLKKTLHG